MQGDIKEEMRVNFMDFYLTVISFLARAFRDALIYNIDSMDCSDY